ncbi:MAG: hypothetical protein FH749_01255 [Firmicutes bacterium]|nr:hypothetical protein [Bacillota bacterium]
MTRKNYLLIALVSVFLACALSVYWMYTDVRLQALTVPPFGFGDNYTAINVYKHDYIEPDEAQDLLSSIFDLVQESDTLLIYETYNRLALYDPAGIYGEEPLVEGGYLERDDFMPEASAVLIKAGSSAHDMLSDGVTIVGGQWAPVRGVYDREHPLHTLQHDKIEIFFAIADVQGTYYFPGESDSIQPIVSLLNENDYTVDYLPPPDSMGSALHSMASGVPYAPMIFGVLFLFFNSFLVYYILISRQARIFSIHHRFGATKRSILARVLTNTLPSVITGALLGTLLFYGVFHSFYRDSIDISLFAGVIGVTVASSVLLFLLAFQLQNYWKNGAGLI